jgi:hypothetical protein
LDRILSQASARFRHGVDADWICGANPVTVSKFDTSRSLPEVTDAGRAGLDQTFGIAS